MNYIYKLLYLPAVVTWVAFVFTWRLTNAVFYSLTKRQDCAVWRLGGVEAHDNYILERGHLHGMDICPKCTEEGEE